MPSKRGLGAVPSENKDRLSQELGRIAQEQGKIWAALLSLPLVAKHLFSFILGIGELRIRQRELDLRERELLERIDAEIRAKQDRIDG